MPSIRTNTAIKAAKILRYKAWGNRLQEKMMDLYQKNPLSSKYRRILKRLRNFPKKIAGQPIEYRNIAGRKCGFIHPSEGPSKKYILFLHGGSYLMGPTNSSWVFLYKVSALTGMTVIQPDYPKAPEWDSNRTLDFMEAFYRFIQEKDRPEEIILAGSSAGGGLALSTFFRLRDHHIGIPDKMILISPWVDLTMLDPHMELQESKDISLSIKTLIRAANLYCQNEDMHLPVHSPLFGDLSQLPPVMLLTGAEELFIQAIRELRDKIRQAGGAVEYIEEAGLFHSWPVMHLLPESGEVRKKMARFLGIQ